MNPPPPPPDPQVMRCYEEELKKPIRNLVNGELARSLLIQVGWVGGWAGGRVLCKVSPVWLLIISRGTEPAHIASW